MPRLRRWLRWLLWISLILGVIVGIAGWLIYQDVASQLPDVSDVQKLRQVELAEPMYVYAADGQLMAVFGEVRRYPVHISAVPEQLKQAFLAAEDANFYQHGGVDYKGIARAIWQLATVEKGRRVAGGSTITQQVTRQFFLSSEYSYRRKLAEILLAMRIEAELSKDEIFELYLNKTFFGNRAHGITAAAEFYYGKTLEQLDLDEIATLAGIPKFPTTSNPLNNPQRARQRRDNYVLPRMVLLGFISQQQADAARAVPMHASAHEPPVQVHAPYVAELVRQQMVVRFGEDVLDRGYHVTTTIHPVMQEAANRAVQSGLSQYDHRHGWHGVEQHIELPLPTDIPTLTRHLATIPAQSGLLPAVVTHVHADGGINVVLADGNEVLLPVAASAWTRRKPAQLVQPGDIIRVRAGETAGQWLMDQLPRAQAALVSMEADSGALRALVGGFNFAGNKFNRVTQAKRQPGSSFKPFLYAAAFERGFNPASIVPDEPFEVRDGRGRVWRPQNDGGTFRGPMRLREALVQSRNLVSVRLLNSIGVDFGRAYISQFGFDEHDLPPVLPMALGSASLTPLSIARGYAVFVNGGSRVDPWMIEEIRDRDNKVVFRENPARACHNCAGQQPAVSGSVVDTNLVVDGFNFGALPAPGARGSLPTNLEDENPAATQDQDASTAPGSTADAPRVAPLVIDPRIAWQLRSMMRDVVRRGTGAAARSLGRNDVGGKTGSTNDHKDAWFSGFGGELVTTVWVGRDDSTSLGYREYGGKAALPIWIDYMRVALEGMPVQEDPPPAGLVRVAANGVQEWVKFEDRNRIHAFDLIEEPDPIEIQAEQDAVFDIF